MKRTTAKALIGSTLALGLIAMSGASTASADWSRPTLIAEGTTLPGPILTAGARQATIAWRPADSRELQVRRLGGFGRPSPPRVLTRSLDESATWTMTAENRSGEAVAAWYERGPGSTSRLVARRISSAGRLGKARTIAPPDLVSDESAAGWHPARDVAVSIDAAGDVVVAWTEMHGTEGFKSFDVTSSVVHARRWDSDGRLGTVVDLGSAGDSYPGPAVAATPGGGAVVAWHALPAREPSILLARLTPAGKVRSRRRIADSSTTAPGAVPSLESGPRGDLAVTWSSPTDVVTRQISATGRLGALRALGPVSRTRGVQTAVGPDGSVAALWRRNVAPGNGTNHVVLRRIGPNGKRGPVRVLSRAMGDLLSSHAVAAGSDGTVTAAWRGPAGRLRTVYSRRVGRDGRLGAVRRLTAGTTDYIYGVQLATGRGGRVIAAWSRRINTFAFIQAARFTPPPRGR